MATRREYGYFEKGGKLCIVEKAEVIQDDLNYTYDGSAGLEIPSGSGYWKSPTASITDGLRIEYAYSPLYRINDASDTSLAVTAYDKSSGLLSLTIASCSFTAGDPIVISGSERWNGLHYVNATVSGATTLVLKTKYNGSSVTESFSALKDVDILNDEEDVIDIPNYLAKAIVPYLKGRLAEDTGEMELKEYHMKEFHRMINKVVGAKIVGPRMIIPGVNWQR